MDRVSTTSSTKKHDQNIGPRNYDDIIENFSAHEYPHDIGDTVCNCSRRLRAASAHSVTLTIY